MTFKKSLYSGILILLPLIILFSKGLSSKSMVSAIEETPSVSSSAPEFLPEKSVAEMMNILSFSGEVRPRDEVDVFPDTQGKIRELRVEVGDEVQSDQILADAAYKNISCCRSSQPEFEGCFHSSQAIRRVEGWHVCGSHPGVIVVNQFEYLLEHPLAVFVVFAMASLLGVFLFFTLPMNLYPEFNPPVLSIVTVYPQASSQEVRERITNPLEEKLGSISGLDKMTSYSGHSISRIVLEFRWSASMITIENELRSRLGQMEETLPELAQTPTLYKYDMNDEPIVELAVRSVDGEPLSKITAMVKDRIKPSFEKLEGVAAVDVTGIRDEQVEIAAVRNRLEAFSFNLTMISRILEAQNKTLGSGSFNEDGLEYIIQAEGEFTSLDDIRNTVISYPGRIPIRIKDFANVSRVLEDPKDKVLFNGQPAVRIAILKQHDAHIVQTTDRILNHIRCIVTTISGD